MALRVADLDRAEAFYGGVLGLAVERRLTDEAGAPRSIWLRAGDALLMLELGLRLDVGQPGSGHLLALAVDDLDDWSSRLTTAGVVVEDRTDFTLYIRDPDGHRVGLSTFSNT